MHVLMNRLALLVCCFLLLSLAGVGQGLHFLHPSETQYTQAEDFVTTPDGGYLVAGTRQGRVALFKLDANGELQWDHFVFDDPSAYLESVKTIVQTDDGNYALAVSSRNTGRAGLVKVDPTGEIIWQKFYTDATFSSGPTAQKMALTSDGGFITTTNVWHIDDWFDFQRGRLLRMDENGDTLWTRLLPEGSSNNLRLQYDFAGLDMLEEPLLVHIDGFGSFSIDTISSLLAIDSLINAKDFSGNNWVFNPEDSTLIGGTAPATNYDEILIFSSQSGGFAHQIYPSAANTTRLNILDVLETSTGDFMVVGRLDYAAYVAKIDPSGQVIWENTYAFSDIDNGASSIVETFDGNFAIAGYMTFWNYYNHKGLVFKIDPDGNEIWHTETTANAGEIEAFADIIEGNDHSLIAAGHEGDFLYVNANASNSAPFMVKLSPDGTELWKIRDYDAPNVSYTGTLQLLDNNRYATVGWHVNFGSIEAYSTAFLTSYDTTGHNISNLIRGTAFYDGNGDCALTPAEDSLAQWIVEIQSADQTIYTTTDLHGQYATLVDTGSYTVQLIPLNNYWQPCPPQTVTFSNFFSLDTLDLGVAAAVDCPYLEVDVSTPLLRRCFDNTYTVTYCNDGTLPAEDAYVEVTLDPAFSYLSSSIPLGSQNGDMLTFDIGQLAIGDCGSFSFEVYVDCDSTVLGQTHCVEAHIFPDEICEPSLSTYPEIDLDGSCQGDSTVVFTLKNIGTENMIMESSYVVIEDHVMYFNHAPTFELDIAEETSFEIPATGATYRIQTPQLPGTSYTGYVSLAIEGCGLDDLGEFSTGMVTVFPDEDEESYLSIDCQENIGSYDPNDKQSFPKGYEEEHLIENNTEIEYLIRFQNTGTDTAFRVEIIDTLSSQLIASSIRPGAASHPYTWRLSGENVVAFTFEDILLPDSMVNQAASNGFVKFKIMPQADLPDGTRIDNHADIYFDFNAPVRTNTTFLTIGTDFIEFITATSTLAYPDLAITIAPNPVVAQATFSLVEVAFQEGLLQVYNAQGQLVHQQGFSDHRFSWDATALPSGTYFFAILLDGKHAGRGKMMK